MLGRHWISGVTLVISCAVSVQAGAQVRHLAPLVDGVAWPRAGVSSVTVENRTGAIDAAIVVLDAAAAQMPTVGAPLRIEVRRDGEIATTVFTGAIVDIKPEEGREGSIVVRALNRLHGLTVDIKSRRFKNTSNAAIAARIAEEAGLAFGPTGPEANVTRSSVVQREETDLDFLRARAGSIGYDVSVDDRTLHFRRRPEQTPMSLGCPPMRGQWRLQLQVHLFRPWLSPATVVSSVTVRGRGPKNKENVVGEATRPMIPLSPGASAFTRTPGRLLDLGQVRSLVSDEAAYSAASGTLAALTANDLSAEAAIDGSASLYPGVDVVVDRREGPFDGKHVVVGASHRYQRGSPDGYRTLVRLVRADRGVYVLPEIGNEVLVAFEQADLRHPHVVGSLWDGTFSAEAPFCRPGARRP